ncbi:hypothetical protein BJ508DRAFT_315391 [Ascobolus immersus RN42]|uniref:Uncharacterized protein n=1 Tax=Ascobolus immersus RN42 TaxID=1160509 RepID=A0A3N4HB09_ASCIM|nr:hypothetical protein BJ508DRAFT_315391 [Ascobolus immersus RN42]
MASTSTGDLLQPAREMISQLLSSDTPAIVFAGFCVMSVAGLVLFSRVGNDDKHGEKVKEKEKTKLDKDKANDPKKQESPKGTTDKSGEGVKQVSRYEKELAEADKHGKRISTYQGYMGECDEHFDYFYPNHRVLIREGPLFMRSFVRLILAEITKERKKDGEPPCDFSGLCKQLCREDLSLSYEEDLDWADDDMCWGDSVARHSKWRLAEDKKLIGIWRENKAEYPMHWYILKGCEAFVGCSYGAWLLAFEIVSGSNVYWAEHAVLSREYFEEVFDAYPEVYTENKDQLKDIYNTLKNADRWI